MRRLFEGGAYSSNYCDWQLKSLLHLGQIVITFRTLLHLGQYVITFRTLLHLGLLHTHCMLSVNSILARCEALWNIPIHNEDFYTYSIPSRWDKSRKRKVPCTHAARFTQLWSKQSEFRLGAPSLPPNQFRWPAAFQYNFVLCITKLCGLLLLK